MGATAVEDAVDWSPLCDDGLTLVLVGPQVEPLAKMVKGEEVVPRERPGQECVTVIRGLYSPGMVREVLGAQSAAASPDVVVSFNADVYMDYWRRTLGSLLLSRTPVVVSMYCEYEDSELSKVLAEPTAFSSSALEAGDAYVRRRYRGDADDFLLHTPMDATTTLSARSLWAFEPNPNAHLPPVDCLAKPYRHGVRNSFWTAFVGVASVGEGSGAGGESGRGHHELIVMLLFQSCCLCILGV